MKTVRILALHLAYGGIERAIINMANLLCARYDVEIISVYDMPDAPAFPLDERVKLRYLLKDRPNKDAWKSALSEKRLLALCRESLRAVKIITDKKRAVLTAVRKADDGVFISTRHEDNIVLSKYGRPGVMKIAQLHHDHALEKKCIKAMKNDYQGIDKLVLLTPKLVEEAKEIMAENKHTEIVCIPNYLERLPELPEKKREKVIVAVGRLHRLKGFDRLLRCFAAFHKEAPDWKLRIIGEGEERPRLEEEIKRLGLEDAACLTGRKTGEQVFEELQNASIFALSSLSEGFGFVIIEAMSCGLPVVAFDVRVGPAYIIGGGEEGFLVPDGDEDQYARKLLELAGSEELRTEMGAKARKRAEDFSLEAVAPQWFSLIGG